MKPFKETSFIAGQEIEAGLEDWGNFHIGPSGFSGMDATFSVVIKTNEDRVALGRLLVELGTKLAVPRKKKQSPSGTASQFLPSRRPSHG
jgi:hypothetical protein